MTKKIIQNEADGWQLCIHQWKSPLYTLAQSSAQFRFYHDVEICESHIQTTEEEKKVEKDDAIARC